MKKFEIKNIYGDGHERWANVVMDNVQEEICVHFLEFDEYLEVNAISSKRKAGDIIFGNLYIDLVLEIPPADETAKGYVQPIENSSHICAVGKINKQISPDSMECEIDFLDDHILIEMESAVTFQLDTYVKIVGSLELEIIMRLNDYKKIPDNITSWECNIYFQDALSSFENHDIEKDEFLEIIVILADRQARRYELLSEETRKCLDRMLTELWNTDHYDDVDRITFIVTNIGLVKTHKRILEALKNPEAIDDRILKEIQEYADENQGDISKCNGTSWHPYNSWQHQSFNH